MGFYERRFRAFLGFGSSVIAADGGMQEVFQAMEYLPDARSTHQRSPDEAVHEIQTD